MIIYQLISTNHFFICRIFLEEKTSCLRTNWLSFLPLNSAAESPWVCCVGTSSFSSVVLMRRTWTWYNTLKHCSVMLFYRNGFWNVPSWACLYLSDQNTCVHNTLPSRNLSPEHGSLGSGKKKKTHSNMCMWPAKCPFPSAIHFKTSTHYFLKMSESTNTRGCDSSFICLRVKNISVK